MAKKKKEDSSLGALFVFLPLLLFLIAVATPVVFVLGYVYNSLRTFFIRTTLSGTMSDFWLNKEEKKDYYEILKKLVYVNDIINAANDKAHAHKVSKNKDGQFSARSKVGKEVQATLQEYIPKQNSLYDEKEYYESLPKVRWNKFNKFAKGQKIYLWSSFTWGLSILYFYFSQTKQSLEEIYISYYRVYLHATNSELLEELPMQNGDLELVYVTTIIAITSYFIFGWLFKNTAKKYSPIPDEVTPNNFNNY